MCQCSAPTRPPKLAHREGEPLASLLSFEDKGNESRQSINPRGAGIPGYSESRKAAGVGQGEGGDLSL